MARPVPIQPQLSKVAKQGPASPKGRTRTKRIACVECRQQKARCNAQENAPNPCLRCAARGFLCTLKPDYKRTYKRARNAQLELAYNELRNTLNSLLQPLKGEGEPSIGLLNADLLEKLNHVVNTANALKNEEDENKSRSDQLRQNQPSTSLAIDQAPTIRKKEPLTEKSLHNITLSPDKIEVLFSEYAQHYHPILPVVDIDKGPEKLYRLCPALFWVIMLTLLRRHNDRASATLLLDLSPHVRKLLEELTVSPITRYLPSEFDEPVFNASSVFSVQAFLVVTMWPHLALSLSADSSWNTIGVALFQAVRIGLHSPGHAGDFGNAAKTDDTRQLMLVNEQLRTWTCVNIVSQTIATVLGYPAFTSFDSGLVRYVEKNTYLPVAVKQLIEITDYENQVATTLTGGGVFERTDRGPLIRVLSQRLDKMMLRLGYENMDNYRKLAFLNARVHLYTYHMFDISSAELSIELQRGLIRLFDACVAVIEHCQQAQTLDKGFMKYLPGVYVVSLWQAAFMITKLSFSPLNSVVDFNRGKTMFQAAIYLTLRNSVMRFDMAHRFSGIMKSVWQIFDTLYVRRLLNFGLSITSRMAASVFFDCLMVLRQQSGMIRFMAKHDEDTNSDVEGIDDARALKTQDTESEYHSDNSEALDEKIKDLGLTPSEATLDQRENQSSGSKRSHHTLEEIALRPESSARKIIKTIPLDPVPVHRTAGSQNAPVVQLVLPLEAYKSVLSPKRKEKPTESLPIYGTFNKDFALAQNAAEMPEMPEIDRNVDDFDSELSVLLKDVSLVMNDFGFYGDSLFP